MPLGMLESLCSLYTYIHFWQAFSWTAMFFIVYNKLHRVKKGSWTGNVFGTKPSRDHRKLLMWLPISRRRVGRPTAT